MSGVWERDEVWNSLFAFRRKVLAAQLELTGQPLQPIDKICLVGFPKGSSVQFKWDFSTRSNSAEKKLTELFTYIIGDRVQVARPVQSAGDFQRYKG